MGVELAYTNELAMVELAFGYPLHDADARSGDFVTLNGAQQFTALSVLEGVNRALEADKARASADGEPFDRESWFPKDEVVAEIQEDHRPHRRYLRGVTGLRGYLDRIKRGEFNADEPHHEHQIHALEDSLDFLRDTDPFAQASQGAYAELAGGSGKSRVIADIVAGFKSEEDPGDPNRVLIITPDLAVQSELVGDDGRGGMGKYAAHLQVGVVNQDRKEFDREVVVVTTAMLRRMLQQDANALDAYDLIIADEAHKLLGEVTHGMLKGVRKPILGFTGTSEYSADKHVGTLLPERLRGKGTRALIEEGVLSPVQMWVCKTDQVVYQESGRSDYTAAEIERISRLSERHRIAVDAGIAFFKDNRNGMFTCNTVREAIYLAASMDGMEVSMADGSTRTVRVVAVHGGRDDNHETLRKLQDNEIQAVTIVNIDTGWNVPRLSFTVNLQPPTSRVKAAQGPARSYRRFIDADGRVVTSQTFDLVDVVVRRGRRADDEGSSNPRQITVPQLLGETVYHAGRIIASPEDQNRHDFDISIFPAHIRRAVTVADGVDVRRLAVFGAGLLRESAPEGTFTLSSVAFALGVTVPRLRVVMAAASVWPRNDDYLREPEIDKVARHLLDTREPIT